MAVNWSALPGDIVTSISKILNSDLDLLRLRSVCSSWRSSVPLPRKRYSFPLKVPSPSHGDVNGYFVLNQNTVYRLSPPDHGACAGDSSDGWIFKVSETTNPNTFSLHAPLSSDKIKSPPGMAPKQLNLLNYRISEICKLYSLGFVDVEKSSEHFHSEHFQSYALRKVFVIWDYVDGCEFVALALHHGGELEYWKFGDDKWTKIDTFRIGIWIQDVILCDGKLYANDVTGVIGILDSNLNVTEVSTSFAYGFDRDQQNYLVECKSDLYAITKVPCSDIPEPEFYFDYPAIPEPEFYFDFDNNKLKLSIFKRMNDYWDRVENLGDSVLFLGDDGSFRASVENFGDFKGNCVFLTDVRFYDEGMGSVYGDDSGVYDLESQCIKGLVVAQDYAKLFWPPPSWLMPIASSSGQ